MKKRAQMELGALTAKGNQACRKYNNNKYNLYVKNDFNLLNDMKFFPLLLKRYMIGFG